MKILVTGAKGMVGRALVRNLENLRDKKNRTREKLQIEEIFAYDVDSDLEELEKYCKNADFVFHLAGTNRPKEEGEFAENNTGFTQTLLAGLMHAKKTVPVMLASSIQAGLQGRFAGSAYGLSKKKAEDLVFSYGEAVGASVYVFRFPNIMGHSRPNYNSAVSTFCHAIAHDLPYTVHDRNTVLDLLYIDDLIEGMFDLLEGKVERCSYMQDSDAANLEQNGRFCLINKSYKVSLGEIVDLLLEFKAQPDTLLMPKMPENSFAKKLFSLYLTYLPRERFRYPLQMHADERGSFTEILHTLDCGQVSVNISKPGITKGQHWHNSKWEIFIVVAGQGKIRQRNMDTGEMIEFLVSGDRLEAVYMIPGWTHNIINLSSTENMVTVMTCNEIFDPKHPDTFFEPV